MDPLILSTICHTKIKRIRSLINRRSDEFTMACDLDDIFDIPRHSLEKGSHPSSSTLPVIFNSTNEYFSYYAIAVVRELFATVINELFDESSKNCLFFTQCTKLENKSNDIVEISLSKRVNMSEYRDGTSRGNLVSFSTGQTSICLGIVQYCNFHSNKIGILTVDRKNIPKSFDLLVLSNITSSIREIEALTIFKNNPPKNLLNLFVKSHTNSQTTTASPRSTMAKTNRIRNANALPKKVSNFMREKYNTSQMSAILDSVDMSHNITLIQGPPGTGKTTTITGMLNAIHCALYNSYYEHIINRVLFSNGDKQLEIFNWLEIANSHKPHVMVCASSNVAVDNIIHRIFSNNGFTGGDGNKYTPSMYRLNSKNSDVDIANKIGIEHIAAKTKQMIDTSDDKKKNRVTYLLQRLSFYRQCLRLLSLNFPRVTRLYSGCEMRVLFDAESKAPIGVYFVDHIQKRTSRDYTPPSSENHNHAIEENNNINNSFYFDEINHKKQQQQTLSTLPSYSVKELPEYLFYSQQIINCLSELDSIHFTNLKSAAIADNTSSHKQLLTVLLNECHIVFSTLNSVASFSDWASVRPFDLIVVDEACQSIELSTLIPIVLLKGVSKLVLVGDPNQLPATVFSKDFDNRSLFERIANTNTIVEPIVLNRNYRMSPEISKFPRIMFYPDVKRKHNNNSQIIGSLLVDDKSVYSIESDERQIFYSIGLLPLNFLSTSSDSHYSTTSYTNMFEVNLIMKIIRLLCSIGHSFRFSLKHKIAIISPYRKQVSLINKTLIEEFRGFNMKEFITVSTIDAFQGKERDIILLSLVRGNSSTSIGFLSDCRRMNVGLTRAKYLLFVLGDSDYLYNSSYDLWGRFIQHCHLEKCLFKINNIDINTIFHTLVKDGPHRRVPKDSKESARILNLNITNSLLKEYCLKC